MSSWTELMRSWLKPAPRKVRGRSRSGLRLEVLEGRDTPSIVATESPTPWVPVGPVGISNTDATILSGPNITTGAVNSVAVDPFNPTHALAGSVNGGIWTTADYTTESPVWTPTTDQMPSLAISAVAFSPVVPGLVYAGTGSYSAGGLGPNFAAGVSNAGDGGPAVGLYKSTDGGATWSQIGVPQFAGQRINSLIPTTLNGGKTIFVSTADTGGTTGRPGVYRSDDGGNTWTRLSGANGLPDLPTTTLIADPGNPNRFYTFAIGGLAAGVYMLNTTAGNVTWVNVSNNLPASVQSGARVLLAASGAGVDPVYAAVVDTNSTLQGVFRAVPFGNTYVWTQVGPNGVPPDVTPGRQADLHLALVADPTSDHIVYVGGDRSAGGVMGSVARGDAIADTWTLITGQPPAAPGAPATSPHADMRWMVFAGANAILAGTDGGIYKVTNPQGQGGVPVWTSVNGNLLDTELYQADVDNRGTVDPSDDVYMSAAQDNTESEGSFGQAFNEVQGGDGTIVRADPVNGYRYYSSQFLSLLRRNPDGTLTSPATSINGTGLVLDGGLPFNPVLTLNQSDPNLMLVGGSFQDLFLSSDHGDTFDSIGGVAAGNPLPVPNMTGNATAIAFGTTQIRRAAYVATDDGNIVQSFDVTVNQGNFTVTDFKTVAKGSVAFSVVMDPNNPLIAYAVTNTGVFETTDGMHWVDISGNLPSLVTGNGLTRFYSMALLDHGTSDTSDDELFVGGFGGVFIDHPGVTGAGATSWAKFSTGLPNVVVSDLRYDPLTDTLLAGTFGRGEWQLHVVPTLVVTGDNSGNNMAIYPDPSVPGNFVLTDGLGATESFALSAYRQVTFNGLGGADTITVGSPAAGTPGTTTPLALSVVANGGGDIGDSLVIQDAADPTGQQATLTPATFGAGTGDTIMGSGSVSYTGFDQGNVQVRFGSGSDLFRVVETGAADATYGVSSTGISRVVGGTLSGTYLYSGADQLALFGGSGNDNFDIQSAPGPLTLDGRGGVNSATMSGTAGDDALAAVITSPTDADLTGLAVPVHLTNLQNFHFDGGAGANTFSLSDQSDTVLGSPTDPAAGISFAPTGPNSAVVRLGGVIGFVVSNITSDVVVNGDGNGTGNPDTLLVLGTSAPGLQSAFGEGTTDDGRDVITVSDTQVSLQTLAGTHFLAVDPAFNSGTATFSTIYVAGGNEAGPGGDQITVTPSPQMNIVVDGMGPKRSPGDQLTVLAAGPFTTYQANDPTLGPPETRVLTGDGTTVGYLGIEDVGFGGNGVGSGMVAVATDAGPETQVQVYDRLTGALRYQITPFPGFNGGATVASGDVNGDGIADLIVGAGPGGGPRVAVFDGLSGLQLADFFAYEPSFRGGVNVAAGDIDGDGYADLILGTGVGGGPRVRVLSGKDFSPIRDVFVYESTFRGGVNVAAGDVNADGVPDLVTSAGAGGGPRVVVFSGADLRQLASFFVFDPNSRTGFQAAAGDVNGDGKADVIVGNGAGGPGEVRVFDALSRTVLSDFFVTDPVQPAGGPPAVPVDVGIRVAAADINGDGVDDVVTVKGPGAATPTIRAYQVTGVNPQTRALFPTLQEIRHQDVFDDVPGLGLFVGAGD